MFAPPFFHLFNNTQEMQVAKNVILFTAVCASNCLSGLIKVPSTCIAASVGPQPELPRTISCF